MHIALFYCLPHQQIITINNTCSWRRSLTTILIIQPPPLLSTQVDQQRSSQCHTFETGPIHRIALQTPCHIFYHQSGSRSIHWLHYLSFICVSTTIDGSWCSSHRPWWPISVGVGQAQLTSTKCSRQISNQWRNSTTSHSIQWNTRTESSNYKTRNCWGLLHQHPTRIPNQGH